MNLMELYEEDPRIKYFPRWDKGNPASARNAGIALSRGEYIAFLDSDDWWNKNKLSSMVRELENNQSLSWCAHYLIEWLDGAMRCTQTYPGRSTAIGGTGTVLCRRSLIESVERQRGFIFDENMNRNDDAEFVLHIRNEPSSMIPAYLSYMRLRPDGLEASASRYENAKIIVGACIRNGAFDLAAFHIALFLLHSVGIDPITMYRRLFHEAKPEF